HSRNEAAVCAAVRSWYGIGQAPRRSCHFNRPPEWIRRTAAGHSRQHGLCAKTLWRIGLCRDSTLWKCFPSGHAILFSSTNPLTTRGCPPAMRKLIACNIVSLDGFFSGPDGNVMVMPFDKGFSDYNAERLRAADTLLLGRKSFEMFRSYWPVIAGDESQPAVEREISR